LELGAKASRVPPLGDPVPSVVDKYDKIPKVEGNGEM
jgi:hypothetical protein